MNAIRRDSHHSKAEKVDSLSSRFDLGAELARDEPSVGSIVLNAANTLFKHDELQRNKIVELEDRAQKAEYDASHDTVTGLLNGLGLRDFVGEWTAKEHTPLDTKIIFVAVDINGLKQTNDTKGHHEGDKLLYSVAKTLQSVATAGLREDDAAGVARTGEKGDEFFLVLPARDELRDITTQAGPDESADIIRDKINTLIQIKNEKNRFSLGIYVTTRGALMESDGYETALRQADAEMMKNKKRLYSEISRQGFDI